MQQHNVVLHAPVEGSNDSTVMRWQRSARTGQQAWSEDMGAVRERGWCGEKGSHEIAGNAKTDTKSGQSQYTEVWLLALQDSASLDDKRQWVIGDNVSQQRQDPLVPAGTFWPPQCAGECKTQLIFFR